MSVSEHIFGDENQTETVNGDSRHATPAVDAGSTPGLALRLVASTAVITANWPAIPLGSRSATSSMWASWGPRTSNSTVIDGSSCNT